MLNLSKIENIYLASGATDLRKSINGCSNIVQYQMFLDPFNPSILSSAIEQRQQSRF